MTPEDYRGKLVILYFGYTFCPDICPTTLADLSRMLGAMGPGAERVRVLFVTVDPDRDSLPVMADYVRNFAPEIDGLRGSEDQVTALMRRYRLVYSVDKGGAGRPYTVTHSSSLYVFDGGGEARFLIGAIAGKAEFSAALAAIEGILAESRPAG